MRVRRRMSISFDCFFLTPFSRLACWSRCWEALCCMRVISLFALLSAGLLLLERYVYAVFAI